MRILSLCFFLFPFFLYASDEPSGTARISGQVRDQKSGDRIAFAHAILFRPDGTTMVAGTVSDEHGRFRLEAIAPGSYSLVVQSLGFHALKREGLEISQGQRLDLGTLRLTPSSESIEEVEVKANLKDVVFRADRRVFEVSKDISSSGGNAVDVLRTIPSLTVSPEGNVQLRASEAFTLMVDGKPVPYDAAEYLKTLPAEAIRQVEVITNPSAKFDPDGISGIVHLVTQGRKGNEIKGSLSGSIGTDASNSLSTYFVYPSGKATWTLSASRSLRLPHHLTDVDRVMYGGEKDFFIHGSQEKTNAQEAWSLKGGYAVRLGQASLLEAVLEGGRNAHRRDDFSNVDTWFEGDPASSAVLDSRNRISRDYGAVNLSFSQGAGTGREWSASLFTSASDGDQRFAQDGDSLFLGNTAVLNSFSQVFSLSGPRLTSRAKADAIIPIGESFRLETGIQSDFRATEMRYRMENLPEGSDEWTVLPAYSNDMSLKDQIHSTYATLSHQRERFGATGGLRLEFQDRTLGLKEGDHSYSKLSLFPSLHLSWKGSKGLSWQASYSRRIQRPDERGLNPYPDYFDPFLVSTGNPDLRPDFIDSWEAGLVRESSARSWGLTLFYRHLNDGICPEITEKGDTVFIRAFNFANDRFYGIEGFLQSTFASNKGRWTLNASVFYDDMHGKSPSGQTIKKEAVTGELNSNLSWTIPKPGTTLQLSLSCNSPYKTPMQDVGGYILPGLTLRQRFLKNRLTATCHITSVTGDLRYRIKTVHEAFRSESVTRQIVPVVFSLSWTINGFRSPERMGSSQIQDLDKTGV